MAAAAAQPRPGLHEGKLAAAFERVRELESLLCEERAWFVDNAQLPDEVQLRASFIVPAVAAGCRGKRLEIKRARILRHLSVHCFEYSMCDMAGWSVGRLVSCQRGGSRGGGPQCEQADEEHAEGVGLGVCGGSVLEGRPVDIGVGIIIVQPLFPAAAVRS